jgi:cytochrome c55X
MMLEMHVKTILFIFSFLAALLTALVVQAESSTTESTTATSSARQNELLYFIKHDCGSCHGMTLKGGLGPALLPETLAGKPKSFLVNTILEGRVNTAMPPWKSMLSQQDAIWITEQLQSGSLQQPELAQNNSVLNKSTLNNSTHIKQTKNEQHTGKQP